MEFIKPVDKAQEAEVRWWKIHIEIARTLGESEGVEYTSDTLQRTLKKIEFVISHWRQAESDETEPGIQFGPKIIKRCRIYVTSVLQKIFREKQSIEIDALKYGMKELPHFVVSAKNLRKNG